jgi:hypothetical protein
MLMFPCLRFGVTLGFAAALTSFASAAPITYIESVSGDLSGLAPAVFTLDEGLNTVSGTTGFTSSTNDFDSFAFVVPDGLQVNGIKVIISDISGDFDDAIWGLYHGGTGLNEGTRLQFVTVPAPGSFSVPAVPLPAGSYNFSAARNDFTGSPVSADYTFIIDAAPVPEPATSLSALAIAAALAFHRRRRHPTPPQPFDPPLVPKK